MRPGKQPWSSTMARRFRGSAARSRSWFTTVSASISALMVPLVLTSRTSNQPLHSIEIKDLIFNETINFGLQNVRKCVKTSVKIFHILCDIVKLLLFFSDHKYNAQSHSIYKKIKIKIVTSSKSSHLRS